jgi:site-specific recombinase XerD
MDNSKPHLQPFFDSLAHMLSKDVVYTPPLKGVFLQDYMRAKEFLLSYQGSQDTFNAYRREIERFLQWCQLKANKSLTQIKREEFESYLEFCQKPPKSWIALKNEPRFVLKNGSRIPNKKWRPFVVMVSKVDTKAGKAADKQNYALSEKAFKALFAVISSFYNFLIQENYTMLNPVLLIRQKSRYLKKTKIGPKIRRLSELQWGYVLETAEIAAEADPDRYERTLFILNALYGMYLRISELTASERWTPTMGDFERDPDGNWWFNTVGKGNKARKICVSDAMLKALKHYRKYLKLPALPCVGERTPLITKSRTNAAVKSVRYIRSIVQEAFDQAIERLREDNQAEEAEQLAVATVHWLRHTGISDDVKIRPREHVRDDAGHSSSAITDRYIDIELRERHASAKKKSIKPQFLLDILPKTPA